MKDIAKDSANRNERQEIISAYNKWVDDVSEECDWKTHITQEEVNAKYSELAISFAIYELLDILVTATDPTTRQKLSARIDHLSSLIK